MAMTIITPPRMGTASVHIALRKACSCTVRQTQSAVKGPATFLNA